MENGLIVKEYTALVPMGGAFEGEVAIHSTQALSLEQAQKWAANRFNRLAVVVEDVNHRWLHTTSFSEKGAHEKFQNQLKALYNEGVRKLWATYKKERGLNNNKIAELMGLTADSVKTMTQPNSALPKWAVALLWEWQQGKYATH